MSIRPDWQQMLNDLLRYSEDTSRLAVALGRGGAIANSPLIIADTTKLRERVARIGKRDGFKACAVVL
jgi:hypothetical protein